MGKGTPKVVLVTDEPLLEVLPLLPNEVDLTRETLFEVVQDAVIDKLLPGEFGLGLVAGGSFEATWIDVEGGFEGHVPIVGFGEESFRGGGSGAEGMVETFIDVLRLKSGVLHEVFNDSDGEGRRGKSRRDSRHV